MTECHFYIEAAVCGKPLCTAAMWCTEVETPEASYHVLNEAS
jgi:hypothetical protein